MPTHTDLLNMSRIILYEIIRVDHLRLFCFNLQCLFLISLLFERLSDEVNVLHYFFSVSQHDPFIYCTSEQQK